MKNSIKNTLLVLTIVVSWISFAQAQKNYIRLTDASGINMDSYQAELQAAADSLVAVFPKAFRDSFKVYDFGFYLHNESYTGGYPEAFQLAIDEVSAQSPYYLLFGKQTDNSGVYTKFWVDLKLPVSWLGVCFDEAYIEIMRSDVINESSRLKEQYPDVQSFARVETEVMNFLRGKVVCCQPFEEFESSCDGCISSKDVSNILETKGFVAISTCTILNKDTTVDNNCLCFPSVATKKALIEDIEDGTVINAIDLIVLIEGKELDFGQPLSNVFSQESLTIISDNSTFCNQQQFSSMENEFELASKATWIHVWANPLNSSDDILFVRQKRELGTNNYIDDQQLGPEIIVEDQPPFKFELHHRSFAPWDRFGHFPLTPYWHIAKNSFHGDGRGFSLKKPSSAIKHPTNEVTSRLMQYCKFDLRGTILGASHSASETMGFKNFIRRIPSDGWFPEKILEEQVEQQEPSGHEKVKLLANGSTHINMRVEGSNPLVSLLSPFLDYDPTTPDIDNQLYARFYYVPNESSLYIHGRVLNKGFPAHEVYLKDNCDNKVFLNTYTSPCESELASELMGPGYDYSKRFNFKIELDANGCFKEGIVLLNLVGQFNFVQVGDSYSISEWNTLNRDKKAAQDCPNQPCEGAYKNNGDNFKSYFNCGW